MTKSSYVKNKAYKDAARLLKGFIEAVYKVNHKNPKFYLSFPQPCLSFYVIIGMNTQHKISSTALQLVLLADKKNTGAEFTVRSRETQKDFTYKIKRQAFKGVWYTHIFVEKNYLEFDYLGSYFIGKVWLKKQEVKTPAAIAIAWVLNKVQESKFTLLDTKIDLFHLGSCLRCGKTLTDAESIEHGLGPVCRNL